MPYRRKARYAKKSYRRRKVYRRKRMMRRAKADKGHLEKITTTYPLVINGAATGAQGVVNWLATGPDGGGFEAYVTGGSIAIKT